MRRGGKEGKAILKLILLLLALFGIYFLLGRYWKRRFAFDPGYDAIHLVRTRDDWRIALYRYPAVSQRYEIPILLCHGLGANRFNFDLGPDVSLARYLQQEGFEVWSIDLRGRGHSRRYPMGNGRRVRPHVFDDYVKKDAEAAIRHVLDQTGASKVHWIGHSMGGLVLFALLQSAEAEAIASGVAIGSPGSFARIGGTSLANVSFRFLRYFPRIPLSFLAAGLAPLLARIRLPGDSLFMNRNNVDVQPVERALCYLVADMSGGEVAQFMDWEKSGEFRTFDGLTSYEANYPSVRQPLLFIAGAKDYLVPPASVAAVHDRISSEKKDFVVLGKQHGQEQDYGHGDLLIGKNVRREVFPRILDWLVSVESG